jgi:hypothetical protein
MPVQNNLVFASRGESCLRDNIHADSHFYHCLPLSPPKSPRDRKVFPPEGNCGATRLLWCYPVCVTGGISRNEVEVWRFELWVTRKFAGEKRNRVLGK